MALKLAAARQFLLEYLGNVKELKRAKLLSDFKQKNELGADEMARLIAMIPPPAAYDAKKLGTDLMTIPIQLPAATGGDYIVQLPPDYHHLRAYPVLMLLHSGRDKADQTVKRFSEEAKKKGFILVAPQWTAGAPGAKMRYQYSLREHDVVTETLRDLRRRFQVDSDRVFLFGWEDGATMALDVGLGHPDLFAGVVSMNGTLSTFARRFYLHNAQYLPLYIIEGDRNGGNPKIFVEAAQDLDTQPIHDDLRRIPGAILRVVQRRDSHHVQLDGPQETPSSPEGNGPAWHRWPRQRRGISFRPQQRQPLLLAKHFDELPATRPVRRRLDHLPR